MKKFLKILLAVIAVSCMSLCFVACGGEKSINNEEIYDPETNVVNYKPYNQISDALYLNDYDVDEISGDWMILSYDYEIQTSYDPVEYTTYYNFALYNWAEDTRVSYVEGLSANENPYELFTYSDVTVGVEIIGEGANIYYAKDKMLSIDPISTPITSRDERAIQIGENIFVVENDKSIRTFTNDRIDVSSIDEYVAGYFYDYKDNAVTIYDSELNFKSYLEIASYVDDPETFILNNGNILFQYVYEQDIISYDYDFIENGKKYMLETFIYNIETNERINLEVDYYFTSVTTADSNSLNEPFVEYGLNEEIENIAYAKPIVNNRIDGSKEAYVSLILSNLGEISVIEKLDEFQNKATLTGLPNGYFYAKNLIGETILFDSLYQEVKIFSANCSITNGYILDKDIYYDFSGNIIFDNTAEEYTVYENLKTGVIFEKEEPSYDYNLEMDYVIRTYYLMTNNAFNEEPIATLNYYPLNGMIEGSSVVKINNYAYAVITVSHNDMLDRQSYSAVIYNEKGSEITQITPNNGVITSLNISSMDADMDKSLIKMTVTQFNYALSDYETTTNYHVLSYGRQ